MKNKAKLIIFFLIGMTFLSSCSQVKAPDNSQPANISPAATTTNNSPTPSSISAEPQFLPVDEADQNADFMQFRDKLIQCVQEKDSKFLLDHIDKNIRCSFGTENGYDAFVSQWELDKNPQDSKVWSELDKILHLGGSFSSEKKDSFWAPYVYSKFPDTYDAFTYFAVTGDNVPVFSAEDTNSEVIANLKYAIIMKDSSAGSNSGLNNPFVKVVLSSNESGFVESKYIRSPIDYRIELANENGGWYIRCFVSGD